jgi:hypothetical protein
MSLFFYSKSVHFGLKRNSGPILFNGKTENINVEIYFNYSPYSGLFANGMRLIAK